MNRFDDLFDEADAAFNATYQEELNQLKGLSPEVIASITPNIKEYTALIRVVEKASKENISKSGSFQILEESYRNDEYAAKFQIFYNDLKVKKFLSKKNSNEILYISWVRFSKYLFNFINTVVFPAASKPNIIFILSDDLAQGDIGCYGQKLIQTPNLDRMAKEGTRFTQGYCGTTVCAPSRNSFLSGLRPDVTAIFNFDNHIREMNQPQITTLPQVSRNS